MKKQIDFLQFLALDLRIGEIVLVKEVLGSEKLLELQVNFGEEIGERTIYAGIKKWYEGKSLIGRKLIFVINLAPKVFKISDREYTSEGMLMAAGEGEAVLYSFDKDLAPGTEVH